MLEFQENNRITPRDFSQCHNGLGTLSCKSLLGGFHSDFFSLFHVDDIPAGVTIGLHPHEHNEEIYYLVSGKGILQYDNNEYEMNPGDISLCKKGHSHGFIATADSVLIVVGNL